MTQIAGLPEVDGRKIPFELIDEYPIRSLGKLLEDTERQKINALADQFGLPGRRHQSHASELAEIHSLARRQDVKIMFASIGFESFSDRLLHYFCKGITVADIVRCVETLRRLKDKFGSHFLYRRDEGANHGFIRPTPWDDGETMQEMDRNIFLHRLFEDILPESQHPAYHPPCIVPWRLDQADRINNRHHVQKGRNLDRMVESLPGIDLPTRHTGISYLDSAEENSDQSRSSLL